jgi:ribonucleoside-diphosphate reductase alpha chain
MNTEHEPELEDAEEVVYVLFSQSINHEIIVNFMNMVESGKLQLLTKRESRYYDLDDAEAFKTEVLPHIEVDFLVEEVANLKTKQLQSGQFTLEQLTKRVGKDRYSAVAYGLWYISKFEDNYENEGNYSAIDYLFIN